MHISLVEASYILLFIVAVSSLYSIIVSNKTNRLITFFLVPLIISASIVSFYAIHSLQGRAIHEWPKGEIQIVSITVKKPKIWLTVIHKGDIEPKFYGIQWTTENAKQIQRLAKRMELGISAEGEFKTPRDPKSGGSFSQGPRYWQPLKQKQIRKEDQ